MTTLESVPVTEVDWGLVLVCLKPKSVVVESDKSVEVKNLFVIKILDIFRNTVRL